MSEIIITQIKRRRDDESLWLSEEMNSTVPVVKFQWRNRNPGPTCAGFDASSRHKFSGQDLRRNYKYCALRNDSTCLSII